MKRIASIAIFLLLGGCPTTRPRDRVEVAPGIYEDTLLSELAPEQYVEVCRAGGDTCTVATTPSEPLFCVSSEGGVCPLAPFDDTNDELFGCILSLQVRIEWNRTNDCTTATVNDWIQCNREQLEQCRTAPGRWNVPSCAPVACQ